MEIFLAILGILGTLGGAFLGGKIAYKYSVDLANIQDFNKAANTFRDAFTEEIRLLSSTIENERDLGNSAWIIIKNAFIKHEAAKINFCHFLSGDELIRFEKAWSIYRCEDFRKEADPNEYTGCYASHSDSHDHELEQRNLAKKRIYDLFEFAKHHKVCFKIPLSWLFKNNC